MSQITWDRLEDRTFESGVDRGVFYPSSRQNGVAWNGLVSINENPTEAMFTPEYQDGVKVYNQATLQEYSATLQAFTYPEEFELCDGIAEYVDGVFVDDQPRTRFHLTYRTMIGNAVDGPRSSYKIHLLYNALALPSTKTYTTYREAQDPSVFSWELTSTPLIIPNHKPASHFIVDSRKTGPLALEHLERILYGRGGGNPRMPTAEQLYSNFDEWRVLYPSLDTYPSPTTYPGGH